MVEIRAFQGLRYNLKKAGKPERLVAPPYDVISREYREELRKRAPYNCIHVTLGEEIEENRQLGLYGQARKNLEDWTAKGILAKESSPAIYAYEQVYSAKGKKYSRKGFIPLVKLEPFEEGNVLPHEFTLSGPKADRLELLRATQANTECIFALYRDDSGKIKKLLEKVSKRPPLLKLKDDNRILNRLWAITDPQEIGVITETMKGKKLFIADGHHRYETHLKYFEENPKADAMPILLVEMNDPGLIVLPTHRLLYGIKGFDFAKFCKALQQWFETKELKGSTKELEKKLAAKKGKAFIAKGKGKTLLFWLKKDVDLASLMPDLVKEIRELDVSILHKIVIEKMLGISADQIARKEHIEYVKDFSDALKKADSGKYDVAFLMNATKKEQVVESCLAGQRMPQKSTYFYPKILSGLFYRKIE
ncbi:MAG: DUF1015 domain-containing protein [Candidatus Diapherotrites archaeon]|nr:DUF1015 domain-containing protein [Candidatus Diapherotrites archaeon]